MANRSNRKEIARETVSILEAGRYMSPAGDEVVIKASLQVAQSGSRVFTPEEEFPAPTAPFETFTEVTSETTFGAAMRLADEGKRACCLNFASAKNPGGGFLNGSQAQEESLSRASGLYHCLLKADAYYDKNRSCGTSLYTDHLIYSPRVPVFRDHRDALLNAPFRVSIITAPAVNAGAARMNEPQKVDQIEPKMRERTRRVLALAASEGETHLVLGAWGCGVFRNDPADMARWFGEHLLPDGEFARAFEHVVFAVFDRTKEGRYIQPFREIFDR